MKFLSDILAKAGLTVDGVVTFNNTATGQTPATNDNSTKLATTAFIKNQSYLTANQTITVSGDATGSGVTSIVLTLANSGVTAGSYGNASNIPTITVDAKGRITSISTNAVSIITTLAGLSDVTLTSPSANQVLQYNGTQWVNGAAPTSYTLPIASGVTLGGIKIGSGLSINGSGIVSVAAASGVGAIRALQQITATAGQTVFTVSGGYTPGLIDVFLNGVLLTPTAITSTNGTTFTLGDGALVNDLLDIFIYNPIYNGFISNTDQVPEGATNLYYTNARARASISLTTTGSSGAATYNSSTGVLNIPSYIGGVVSIFGRTGTVIAVSGDYTTTLVTEGTNLYYTDARARAAISVTGSGSYNSSTGVITVTGGVTSVNTLTGAVVLTTTNIAEGTNLYYTDARVGTYLTANSYATQTYVGTQIANLVASAPATLDTLNELAVALGNDPNFATTVATSIGTKVPQTRTITINGTALDLSADRSFTIAGGVTSFNTRTGAITPTSGDYTTALVTESGNLYYTDARARAAITLTTTGTSGAATYTSGVLNIPNYTTDLSALAVQDGTILYSPTRAFTPTGTISTSGTTVTTVGNHFSSAVVGMKLTISGETRIITVYTSATQVTVASAYSQNYSAVAIGSWGVYYKVFEVKTDGYPYFYLGNQSGGAPPGTTFLYNQAGFPTTQYGFQVPNSLLLNSSGLSYANYCVIKWSSTTSYSEFGATTNDLGLRRNSAGVLEIFNGTTADGTLANRRDLLVRTITGSDALFNGSITAASAIARGSYFNNTLVASANNDVLVGLDINPTFTNGAFTGVQKFAARISGVTIIGNATNTGTRTDIGLGVTTSVNNSAIGVLSTLGSSFHLENIDQTINSYVNMSLRIDNSGNSVYSNISLIKTGSGVGALRIHQQGTQQFSLFTNTGNLTLQNGGTFTDAGFRLDVVGATRISGVLTLSSTISNGTYTYTLPSATGTLALTSDLSAYVPTSRTLTINGTSYDLSANRSWTIAPDVSVRNTYAFTATAAQTTFTVTGGYSVGLVDVFINGVKLAAADFTATNGTTVVLGTGTGVGNIVEIVKYVSAFTTAQEALNGTGLVRMAGTVVSYDNATYATQSYVTTAVANLVNSAPSTLDTLNELATALGNDANFATTITTSIATKLPLTGGTLTGALNGTSATFSGSVISQSAIPFIFRNSSNILRWELDREGAETGANAGSNLTFYRFDDAGAYLGTSLSITRSNGTVTLGGALSGTSASFSGDVISSTGTTGAKIKLGGFTNYGTIQDVNDVRRIWFENTGSYRTIFDLPSAGTSFDFRTNSGTPLLTIASTGAATLSNSLTVNGIYYVPVSSYFISGSAGFRFNNSTDAYNNFIVYDNGSTYTRGAASFSSTVTTGGDITVSKSGDSGINLNSTTTNGVAVTRYKTTAAGNLWGTGINITAADSRWEIYNFALGASPFILSTTGAATFSSSVTIGGTFVQNPSSGSGGLYIDRGTSSTSPYISWFNGSGTRLGYMGYSNSNIGLYLENSAVFQISGGVIRSIDTYNNTSANIPNMYVSSGGTFERGTSSSKRFKDNITEWDGKGLETILALKPTTFTYIESYYKHPERVMLGLIAEDVAEVCPYLADYENEDGTGQVENVRYATIVVPLIKAIQELKAEIDILKAR